MTMKRERGGIKRSRCGLRREEGAQPKNGFEAGKNPSAGSGRGGEGGIRTPDTVARMPHFECGAFNHSATSPTPVRCITKLIGNQQNPLRDCIVTIVATNAVAK